MDQDDISEQHASFFFFLHIVHAFSLLFGLVFIVSILLGISVVCLPFARTFLQSDGVQRTMWGPLLLVIGFWPLWAAAAFVTGCMGLGVARIAERWKSTKEKENVRRLVMSARFNLGLFGVVILISLAASTFLIAAVSWQSFHLR